MPTYRDLDTNVVVDLPENIGNHPILGARLVLVEPGEPVAVEPVEVDVPEMTPAPQGE